VKFGRVIIELRKRTDRQTNRQADHNTSHQYRQRSENWWLA